jgi:hypothetical protein
MGRVSLHTAFGILLPAGCMQRRDRMSCARAVARLKRIARTFQWTTAYLEVDLAAVGPQRTAALGRCQQKGWHGGKSLIVGALLIGIVVLGTCTG